MAAAEVMDTGPSPSPPASPQPSNPPTPRSNTPDPPTPDSILLPVNIVPPSPLKDLKIAITTLNPYITCSICNGYLIEATAITECLHTFCKTCIVQYLQSSKACPECKLKIHETQPILKLKLDRTLQDIVYKLVPNLFENEENRKETFYQQRGIPYISQDAVARIKPVVQVDITKSSHDFQRDEKIVVCFERSRTNRNVFPLPLPELERKFVCCPARAKISHIKQLLRLKLKVSKLVDVDIHCADQIVPMNFSLKQVKVIHWQDRTSPLILQYNVRPSPQHRHRLPGRSHTIAHVGDGIRGPLAT